MTCLTCPQGHREYHKYDSLIRCQGRAIPVLAAYNTAEAKERTGKPHWCPIDPVEIVEVPKLTKQLEKPKGPNKLLTDEQVREIRKNFKKGKSINTMAKEYGVAWSTVRRAAVRTNYKSVI